MLRLRSNVELVNLTRDYDRIVPERDVLASVLALLERHPAVGNVWRNNRGKHRIQNADGTSRWIAYGGPPGASDIIGYLQTGGILAVECKRKGERPTAEQQKFLDGVNATAGGLGFVARSVDDVMKALPR